jgi:5-methylcytosine-specific restriction endonuclease McrBC GTP-binding regulatory subunit McrB
MPYTVMADLAGYVGSVVQGFQSYSNVGVQNMIAKYGSVEKFFFNKEPQSKVIMSNEIIPVTNNKYIDAIRTKPFVLLAGLSGTGKSRLVRTLAFKSCKNEILRQNKRKPGNFELIPVRPNWHDSTELMGYVSRIGGEKYITTTFLKFIAKAWRYLDVPFFLCIDEMNLAPVEQYFAEFLSIIETRQVKENLIQTDFLISKDALRTQMYMK